LTDRSPQDERYDRFVSLLARQERVVRGYVRSLLPSGQDVDDVLQNVGLACWRKFADFDPQGTPEEFARWACVIARFEVLKHRRSIARDRLVLSEDVIQLLATDAEVRLEQAAVERVAINECLKSLSAQERRLLLSVHTPGDSIARIASDLGQDARRLYSRVEALRERLRECVRARLAETEVMT
jgi:RNA polymerase sigma-70 factor (ECF subfamily)